MDVRVVGVEDRAVHQAIAALFDAELAEGIGTADDVRSWCSEGDTRVVAAFDGRRANAPLLAAVTVATLARGAHPYYAPFGVEAGALLARCALGSVKDVAVAPAARRRGLAQTLVKEGLGWLVGRGCDLAVALSWVNGTAATSAPLFERLGFRSMGQRAGFYREQSAAEGWRCRRCGGACDCPAILYVRDLP